jgi:type III restriction enzyme
MKLHFDPSLDYQLQAVEAVCDYLPRAGDMSQRVYHHQKRTKYQRLGDEYFYAQKLFDQKELMGYLKNVFDSENSIYEKVVYDAETEAAYANQLEKNRAIKAYAKLPGWFTVPMPLLLPKLWAISPAPGACHKWLVIPACPAKVFTEHSRVSEPQI